MLKNLSRPSRVAPLLAALVLAGCAPQTAGGGAETPACGTVTAVEGVYECSGECVVTAEDGSRQLVPVSGETDTVRRFPGSTLGIYEVSITGANDFTETEIGALAGLTLRTATAAVSDEIFPVLEEYVFEAGPNCAAVGFTKLVRNPSREGFKACIINCSKSP